MDYRYADASGGHAHAYLMEPVSAELANLAPRSVFDLGCGNGSFSNGLSKTYAVTGIDTSTTGVAHAQRAFPHMRIEVASVYDDLADRYGQFDAVVSLEVVEHLIDPRLYVARMFALTRPGGGIVVSTPYHGYVKNLALAVSGKMDQHFTALWDGGHIKFWSVRTLRTLLEEAGFSEVRFRFAGRIPALARSMVAVAQRPDA